MGHSTPTCRQRAALYRKAALLLEKRAKSVWPNAHLVDYACEAIETAIGRWHDDGIPHACQAMRDVFDPDRCHGSAWLAGVGSDDSDMEADREGRVLALCFMAAIVEAGDA